MVSKVQSLQTPKFSVRDRRWSVGLTFVSAGFFSVACDRKDANPPPAVLNLVADCQTQPLALQPTERFPQATAFYLPYARNTAFPDALAPQDAGGTACPQVDWQLVGKPVSSAADVGGLRRGLNGAQRFVPDVPGDYRFEGRPVTEGGERQVVTLNVVGLKDVPFHNFNYATSSSLVAKGSAVWVADAIGQRVSAIDPAGRTVLSSIPVGGWPVAVAPAGDATLLVLQKAADSLGFVDVAAGRLVDAIPVGDEPSDLVVSPDGLRAYVSLATTAQVAVVDLALREVIARIDVVMDPRALALSRDGKTLYVSAFRSGTSERYPYPDVPAEEQKDIAVVDTTTLKTVRTFGDLGTTLQQIVLSPDEKTLYVSRVVVNTVTPLAAPGNQSFGYQVAELDVTTGAVVRTRAFQARPEVADDLPLVTPVGMALSKDSLWVAFEASDALVELGVSDLAERRRFVAPGRPRAVLVVDGRVLVHGPQSFDLTVVDGENANTFKVSAWDPRGPLLAEGQRYFTGAGQGYAKGWSCNSCHVEGLTDKVVWNAGPVKDTHVSKPFFWLEGTAPLGWQGYMSSVRNYSYEVHSNIGIRADNDKVAALQSYLRSLTVPPPANSKTELDGSLSAQGRRGEQVFNGSGRCAACHAGPVGTNGVTFAVSSTEDPAEVPSLVGGYRHGVWLKHGEARTLRQAVDNMVAYAGAKLTEAEIVDLERYLEEMTGRDFFLMSVTPESRKQIGSAVVADLVPVDLDVPFELVFSLPVLGTPENLERIKLVDSNGAEVPVRRTLVGPRTIEIVLDGAAGVSRLNSGAQYALELSPNFQAFGPQKLTGRTTVKLATAAAPVLGFAGSYVMRFYSPRLVTAPQGNYFDVTQTRPVDVPLIADPTASGAVVTLDLKGGLTFPTRAVVSGDVLYIPPTPIPAGPISFVDGFSGYSSTFVDQDGDGIGDTASGTYTYAGPGFRIEGMKWELVRTTTPVSPAAPAAPVVPSPGTPRFASSHQERSALR